jgi:hypothetical protein
LNDAQRIDVVDRLFSLKEKKDAEYRMKNPEANLPQGVKGQSRDKLGSIAKVSGMTYQKGKKIKDNDKELWDKCLSGEVSIDKASKQMNKQKKQEEREKESEESKNIIIDDNEIDFRYGDFMKVLDDIPDGSVDLILSDPPYPIEFIDEWEKLSKFASKKLKPNGFCICYSGPKNLSEVFNRMNKYLDYYWTFALILKGNTQIINFNNIIAGWKPIIIFQNGFKKKKDVVSDVIIGSGRSKSNTAIVNEKDWEQSEDELVYLINNFSKEGDIIVDPFVGSGTTLIAVKNNNRIGIGAEIDKTTFNLAKKRINDELG